ncbi:hypothetical protein CP533_3289 [Ophiocordyceps camponoti-saundersi (nom. inval.)]|nr:hypothetical protein CP533_3289 [Ophiocordyceps camponoti-saundersi (nom. inval.)]
MNNFGVIELAGGKTTTAPGWAYVPDTGPSQGGPSQPANRKRARSGPGSTRLSLGDVSARQEAKTRKEVEALDRDWGRDNSIPLPGRAATKHTPNVRKILQSQKTFANHLDDFVAMQALAEANAAQAAQGSGAKSTHTPNSTAATATTAGAKRPSTRQKKVAIQRPTTGSGMARLADDVDQEALLASRVPEVPSEEELQKLMTLPPLSYLEARAVCDEEDEDNRYPARVFCEVCGYWGRVRCIKCGTRVCALDCLEAHQEECVTRYGL